MFESVVPAILGSPIYRVRGAHWRFFAVAVHGLVTTSRLLVINRTTDDKRVANPTDEP